MATKKQTSREESLDSERDQLGIDVDAIESMSFEELQLFTARTNALTAAYQAHDAKQANLTRKQKEAKRRRDNALRQGEMLAKRQMLARNQANCSHRQGGFKHMLLEGTGDSVLTRARMIDGYTIRISCQRCRLQVFTPNPADRAANPAAYDVELADYKRLLKESKGNNLDPIAGPTFTFLKDGVPYIPARV